MARILVMDSEEAKEVAKWEQHHTRFTSPENPPGNPYHYRPYPAMVYRARLLPNGQPSVGEGNDAVFGGAIGAAEAFSKTCQQIVRSEVEHQKAREAGWRDTPGDALERHSEVERSVSTEAAERHHSDARLSDKARAEASDADAATMDHLPEIPRKRVGRPKKNATAA